MSSYYHYNLASTNGPSSSSHHPSRGPRAPRMLQNKHKQFRSARKEEETASITSFRQRFEAQRSFDIEDDLEFCPNLLTEVDMVSIQSTSSDRSSLSSGSPESSPQSHTVAPQTNFSLNSGSNSYITSGDQPQTAPPKLQASRSRSAIPIVNPSTGLSMSSLSMSNPPQSVSPAMTQQQSISHRW